MPAYQGKSTMFRVMEEGIVLPPPSRLALTSAFAFGVCNLLLSIAFGDLYPFTITPMFRDSPRLYAKYQILDPKGVQLPLRDFELQRNYDGNPLGLGAGVRTPPSLDEFGTAPDTTVVKAHISSILRKRFSRLEYVDVVQTVIGPLDAQRVGVTREARFRVHSNES